MEERTCKTCKQQLPLSEFANAGMAKGIPYRRHQCKKCYSDIKAIRANRIKEEFREFKKTLKCARCGFNDFRALQFHHHNKDKDYAVAQMRGYALETVLREVAKCEVLCANCHSIEHFRV